MLPAPRAFLPATPPAVPPCTRMYLYSRNITSLWTFSPPALRRHSSAVLQRFLHRAWRLQHSRRTPTCAASFVPFIRHVPYRRHSCRRLIQALFPAWHLPGPRATMAQRRRLVMPTARRPAAISSPAAFDGSSYSRAMVCRSPFPGLQATAPCSRCTCAARGLFAPKAPCGSARVLKDRTKTRTTWSKRK